MLQKAVWTLLASGLIQSSFAFYPYPMSNSSYTYPMSNSSYILNVSFSGPTFFDHFNFFTDKDPTQAHVKYLDISAANSSGLVGFDMAGNKSILQAPAYIGTDYHTKTPEGRPSVRIMSKQVFNHSLIIADILHMPASVCGVWPAFWVLGTSRDWPDAGEIDILENINDANYNKYTLHTNAGVSVNNDSSSMKGVMTTSNCDIKAPGQGANEGCSVSDSASTGSYGNLFNQNQGGVFATEINSKGISIWFFNRTHIPADIVQGHPVPPSTNNGSSVWGLPNARFAGNNTDFDGHFRDLQIAFNTAFCGQWTSSMWSKNPTCSKLAPTCEDYVTNNPQDFGEVYWSINSVKVYTRSK